jgi:hypothetical protein
MAPVWEAGGGGTETYVSLRQIIAREFRRRGAGVDFVGDVNAVIAANVGERSPSATHVSSRQRVVQRPGRRAISTDVDTATTEGGSNESGGESPS